MCLVAVSLGVKGIDTWSMSSGIAESSSLTCNYIVDFFEVISLIF